MAELYNQCDNELKAAIRQASDVIGYDSTRRKLAIGILNAEQIASMTAWNPQILMSKAEKQEKVTWLEILQENPDRYNSSQGTYNVFGKWYKLSMDNPEDHATLALLERFCMIADLKNAGKRRPVVNYKYLYLQLVTTNNDGSIGFPAIRDPELRAEMENVVSDLRAEGNRDIHTIVVTITDKYKKQVEDIQVKVENMITAILDNETGAYKEQGNDQPFKQDEIDKMEEVYIEHREDRRKEPKMDVVSKAFVRRFSESYSDVGAKFAEALSAAEEDFSERAFPDIVIGGSGLTCQFGPIIKRLFPNSKLHFCDVNDLCRSAAEKYGEFTCCDIESLASKYPKAPVVSDAVVPRQTGFGRVRATHAFLADNLHQLALMNLGDRPFVVVKLFAPFGVVRNEDGDEASILEWMEEAKPFNAYPGMSRHNTEFIAYKNCLENKVYDKPYEPVVRRSFELERLRHFLFQIGAVPTESFLRNQMNRIDRDPFLKQLLLDVLMDRKPVPAPKAEQPKKKDLSAFRRKAIEQPSPASNLAKPKAFVTTAVAAAVHRPHAEADSNKRKIPQQQQQQQQPNIIDNEKKRREYGDFIRQMKDAGLDDEQAKKAAHAYVYGGRETKGKIEKTETKAQEYVVKTDGRRIIRPSAGASANFRPGQAVGWPKDLGEFYKYVQGKLNVSKEEAMAYAVELSVDNKIMVEEAKEFMLAQGSFTIDDVFQHLKNTVGGGNEITAYYGLCMARSMVIRDRTPGMYTMHPNARDQAMLKRMQGGGEAVFGLN